MSKSKIFHIVFILAVILIAVLVVLRIKGWITVVDLEDILGSDETVANTESHDHIMPLTDAEYNLIRQKEETILILGNDPFAADRGNENGLAAMLEKESGATVINCAVSGSYVSMPAPSFDMSANPMNIFSPYYLSCVACKDTDFTADLAAAKSTLGDAFPEEGEEVLNTLKDLDVTTVDVIVFFYDGVDYLMSAPTGLDDTRYTDPFNSYLGCFTGTVEMFNSATDGARFIAMSAPYMYVAGDDGKLGACEDKPNSEGVDLSEYVLGMHRMCVENYDISFLDNYYAGINYHDGKKYLTDGRYLNKEGRKLMLERLMYALTYYDEENLGNVDFQASN